MQVQEVGGGTTCGRCPRETWQLPKYPRLKRLKTHRYRQRLIGLVFPTRTRFTPHPLDALVSLICSQQHGTPRVPKRFTQMRTLESETMEIQVINHPLIASRMTIMRDERSNNAAFRAALADLGAMLVYEASKDLQVETFDVKTPVAIAEGYRLEKPPIIVPVIRAGLGMIDPALSMIPDAQVGFIGLARDEETHQPVPYLEALPDDLAGQPVFLVDPMLATGGSLLHAINLLAARGADDITCICMISAQPGVDALIDANVPVKKLITATIDPEMNDDAYIVPGLGDAGDRLYGPRNIDLSEL